MEAITPAPFPQFFDNKKPLLAVRTQLVSTIVTRDAHLAHFLSALREVTPNMDDGDLVQVAFFRRRLRVPSCVRENTHAALHTHVLFSRHRGPQATEDLVHADPTALVQFSLLIFDELLTTLARGTASDALLHQCFRALVHVADVYGRGPVHSPQTGRFVDAVVAGGVPGAFFGGLCRGAVCTAQDRWRRGLDGGAPS